jgi:succinyl-CoA synthetase alpha subunit
MRAKNLSGLLKKNDRVAVSNITGREASGVCIASQRYCDNIVGGWALGKGNQVIEVPGRDDIPVFSDCGELYANLPKAKHPNKIIIYSPPSAVYGEVKEAIEYGGKTLETIYIITENVSVEVTAKIHSITKGVNVDVIGCNTLGIINTYDHARVGAIGGDNPEESFRPGSATIISNSGNMTNTIATYMLSAGIGTEFGIATGKDLLILTSLKQYLNLAAKSDKTKLIILYIEPGGLYEKEAIEWLKENKFNKPIIVYVAGTLMEGRNVSLGHAGTVVEGPDTSASGKIALFDEYFGCEAFDPDFKYPQGSLTEAWKRGVRVTRLHHLPLAAMRLYQAMEWQRDFQVQNELKLNPWFVNFQKLADKLPAPLLLRPGLIPAPYHKQLSKQLKESIGLVPARRKMKNSSHASTLDTEGQRIYGYSLTEIMARKSFGDALILNWTGELPSRSFEGKLVEMCLIASLTNGPGTISAQGAKLSASAGNSPHVGMIATLASIGDVHGGNGRQGVSYLMKVFREVGLEDPYNPGTDIDPAQMALTISKKFKKVKDAAKEAGIDYERIPCLGHPVFNDQPVNYDPREQLINSVIKSFGVRNVFLEFYHEIALALRNIGVSSRAWAVNMDAALACVWLAICWKPLIDKQITLQRVEDCAFLGFALGRAAGGAAEFLDHQDYGTDMDMRVPRTECVALSRKRELPDEAKS